MPCARLKQLSKLITIFWTASLLMGQKPVATSKSASEDSLFGDIPVVEAATLRMQTLEEAPSNVTIVTAADIRKYGYRSLGEALANVRGFYSSNDRIYSYVGVRGFSLPGDYNTRFLVMINGHPMTEIIYNSNNFFGQDFGLDMDLVQRIEIIRGPSSVLYGSNGIFANINIVTRSPADSGRIYVSTETDSMGERKATISSSNYLGKGVNLLVSGSIFNAGTKDLYISQYDTPQTNNGVARATDGERGYHTFLNLIWKDWSFTADFSSRQKQSPVSWSDSIFAERANSILDSHNFVQAAYTRSLGRGKFRWQTALDHYRYQDRFYYKRNQYIEDAVTDSAGTWASTHLSYSLPVSRLGALTFGGQADLQFVNFQTYRIAAPVPSVQFNTVNPDRSLGVFAQQELQLTKGLKAYIGARFNVSHNFGNVFTPQVALVYQPSSKTAFKALWGRPFTNPSAFEKYYYDGVGYLAPPHLKPETGNIFEASAERRLRPNLSLIINGFYYRLNDAIQARQVGDSLQYYNGAANRSVGAEFEINGNLGYRLELTASFVLQRAVSLDNNGRLPNSPSQVSKFRIATPLFADKLHWSAAVRTLDARLTRDGGLVRAVALVDTTFTTNRLTPIMDIQFGIRNLLNWIYDDPIDLTISQLRQDGRSLFVKLIWHRE